MLYYRKKSIITNFILAIIIVSVLSVGAWQDKSVTISSSSDYRVFYNGDKSSSNVALMFNVYENTKVVENIIETLSSNGVKATFFVGGCWADDNAKIIKTIIEKGFEVGNHGYFHKDHKNLSEEKNREEIQNCDKIVKSLCGYKMNLFAPPSGSFGKATLKAVSELDYHTVMWSKDTIDWRDSDVNLIVKRATETVEGGDLILMHPKEHTLNALEEIIKVIKSKNLKMVTVSECLALKTEV